MCIEVKIFELFMNVRMVLVQVLNPRYVYIHPSKLSSWKTRIHKHAACLLIGDVKKCIQPQDKCTGTMILIFVKFATHSKQI